MQNRPESIVACRTLIVKFTCKQRINLHQDPCVQSIFAAHPNTMHRSVCSWNSDWDVWFWFLRVNLILFKYMRAPSGARGTLSGEKPNWINSEFNKMFAIDDELGMVKRVSRGNRVVLLSLCHARMNMNVRSLNLMTLFDRSASNQKLRSAYVPVCVCVRLCISPHSIWINVQ